MDDITQTLAHGRAGPIATASSIATCTRCSPTASAACIPTWATLGVQRFIRKRAHQAGGGLTLRYAHPERHRGARRRQAEAAGPAAATRTSWSRTISTPTTSRSRAEQPAIRLVLLSPRLGRREHRHRLGRQRLLPRPVAAASIRACSTPLWCRRRTRWRRRPRSAASGGHAQVCAIAVPPVAILFGNRYWWPVFEAAADMDLPILLHVTGSEGVYNGAPMPAGGMPDTYIERYVTLGQGAEANLNSMIMNGLFERFPTPAHPVRGIRLRLAHPGDAAHGPAVARPAPRGALGQEVAHRLRERARLVHHPADRGAARPSATSSAS